VAHPVDSSDLDRLGGALRQEIRVSAEDGRAHVGQVVADLRQEMRETTAAILDRVDASAAETRRHFDVVAEALRSDIKAVAEGLGALDEKVERFRGEVHHEFAKVDRRLLHLEVRVIGRSGPA
jgi:hypothetical protein